MTDDLLKLLESCRVIHTIQCPCTYHAKAVCQCGSGQTSETILEAAAEIRRLRDEVEQTRLCLLWVAGDLDEAPPLAIKTLCEARATVFPVIKGRLTTAALGRIENGDHHGE